MESINVDFNLLNEKRKQMKIIYIEGNIGSGKSTLVTRLSNYSNSDFEFLTEPCDEWIETKVTINGKSQNMLEIYYNNPKAKATLFQMYALFTRMEKLIYCILETNKKVIICERSPLSDKNCFAKVNTNNGNIDEFDLYVYNKFYDFYSKTNLITPDNIIYLQLNPNHCLDRIKERQRKSESSITIEYLSKLHDLHEQWLCSSDSKNLGYRVDVINAQENFRDDDDILSNFITLINKIAIN